MIDTFKAYLDKTNLSENSKSAYLFALETEITRDPFTKRLCFR